MNSPSATTTAKYYKFGFIEITWSYKDVGLMCSYYHGLIYITLYNIHILFATYYTYILKSESQNFLDPGLARP